MKDAIKYTRGQYNCYTSNVHAVFTAYDEARFERDQHFTFDEN